MKIIRVFPSRNSYTPTDAYAFFGLSPFAAFLPDHDEVHVSCTFTWDKAECEWLRSQWEAMPNKYFDLAIVDPPYGVGTVTYMPRTRTPAVGGFIDKYDVMVATLDMNQRRKMRVDIEHTNNTSTTKSGFGDESVAPSPEYFDELFRVSKHQIIWGGNYYLLPPTRGFVVWRKPSVTENFSMAMCEYAWTSFNCNAKLVEAQANQAPGQRIHPTEKPLKVYEFLLKHFANKGDKILDTHAGSASSLVACHRAGHEYIGFEIDKDYYELANRRLNYEKLQGDLFHDIKT